MKPILSASILVFLATACGSRFQPIADSAVQVEAQADGRLVYRRNFPLVEQEFRQLFS